MAINTASRYTTKIDEKSQQVIAVTQKSKTVSYSNYVTRAGESFESIATRLYRDPRQYWRIAEVNPQVKFPDVIETGTLIRIPS
jgi:nucleoid-associated protein YgaU